MSAPKNQIAAPVDSKTYPLGEKSEPATNGSALALLALTHTATEHRLYLAMLVAGSNGAGRVLFTARELVDLTGIRSLSTIRRGLVGLAAKASVEREPKRPISRLGYANSGTVTAAAYRVFTPEEVLARRNELSTQSANAEIASHAPHHSLHKAIQKVAASPNLSRREAQVALCCVEGLTNAEIGQRLQVTEQTVKFHLRHVFIKLGVKRRAELIARLLM
jgi:DNA-binding CsgD family transcriptional regulator